MRLFPESGNRRRVRVAALIALVGFAIRGAIGPATLRAESPEPLPSDHPRWGDLESLWNRGGFSDLPLFTRPLARVDIARSFLSTVANDPALASSPPARRLERELAQEIESQGGAPANARRAPLFESSAGGASLRVESVVTLVGTLTEDEAHAQEGTRAGAVFRVDLGERAFASTDVAIERILDTTNLGDAIVKGTEWYLNTDRAGLIVRTGAADFELGFDRNRWGPGSSGTLLLSDAAPSYPQISFGRTFGARARFAAVTGSLHAPENRWFSAHRLEIAFTPALHLGIHEAAAYASEGVDLLYAVNLVPYTIVQRAFDRTSTTGASIAANRNNVMAGADVVWRFARGWRVDGELLLDEVSTESSAIPNRIAYQLGASWAGRVSNRSVDARVEATKVDPFTYAVFYGADFLQDDIPLGYSRGPDVEFARATFDTDVSTSLRVGLGLDAERHGEGRPGDFWDPEDPPPSDGSPSGVVQRTWFPHARLRVTWDDVLDAFARCGVRRVENEDHVRGKDSTSFFAELSTRWEW